MRARVRYRRSVDRLDASQLADLRASFTAVMRISDQRGYDHHAGIHGLPEQLCQHGTRLFLPWHRAYLYFFELALQEQVPGVTIPWWDWTAPASDRSGIPRAYARATVDRRPNPLYRASVPPAAREGGQPRRTSRSPGSPTSLPTRADVARVLALGDFSDFQSALEDIHAWVHGWTGGTMGLVPWAAYDPIFWAHHSMIDRIWRMWQARHSRVLLDPDLLSGALPPFNMTVAETVEVTALGYEYAGSTLTVSPAGS